MTAETKFQEKERVSQAVEEIHLPTLAADDMCTAPLPPCKGLRPHTHLLQVPLYVAGKSVDEISGELGLEDVLKLNSNENPLGPSPMAVAALKKSLSEMHRYPGTAERELRWKLSACHGLGEQHFVIGNGGTDVLRMIAQAFMGHGDESLLCRVSFPVYALLTTMYGGTVVKVEPDPDYHIDLAAMAEAVTDRTRIVWLCSPNNPTGYCLIQQSMDEFLARLPDGIIVVLDEAYADYATDRDCVKGVRYVQQGRNVVVVRSASKSLGLANLRVGYGIAPPHLIEYLMRTILPFGTGALALRAAAAGLDDQDFQRRCRELVLEERAFLSMRLSEMGLNCLASEANYLLVIDPPVDVPTLIDALLHQGVAVRSMGPFGLPNAFRVSIGLRSENERFLEALRRSLAEVRKTEQKKGSPWRIAQA